MAKRTNPKTIETLTHTDATRKNIPTAEYQSVLHHEHENPIEVPYARRNRDLDPQLVWRGKDEQDWSDLVVQAPPLYIQEKVHPKALIDDLAAISQQPAAIGQLNLFADAGQIATSLHQHSYKLFVRPWPKRGLTGRA